VTSDWHIAQVNIALLRAPLDAPELVALRESLHALARRREVGAIYVGDVQTDTDPAVEREVEELPGRLPRFLGPVQL